MQKIAQSFVKAQKAFGPALKSSTNPHFRTKYADLSACVEAVIDALNDNGIALVQQTHDCDNGVIVETIFVHESGEMLSNGRLHVPDLLLTLGLLAAVLGLLMAAERTRLGTAWRMTGQDDVLTAAQGVSVARMRLLVAALAGGLAALGGGLYAHRTTYIEPALFDPMLGVHAVGYALLGGLGTALGPLLGVAIDLGLLDASRLFPGWRMVIFGGLVALFLRWRPRGLLDEVLVHRLGQWLRRRPPVQPSNPQTTP